MLSTAGEGSTRVEGDIMKMKFDIFPFRSLTSASHAGKDVGYDAMYGKLKPIGRLAAQVS